MLNGLDAKGKVATQNHSQKESPKRSEDTEVKADRFFIIVFASLGFMVCLSIYMVVTL
jgi:hypothetical protein